MLHLRLSKSALGLIVCGLVALAAAACGGGGGSATPAIVPHPRPSPTVACQIRIQPGVRAFGSEIAENFSHAVLPKSVGPGPAIRTCPNAAPGTMRCFAWLRVDIGPDVPPSGYGPAQLQNAYGLATASSGGGVGQVVAIVDAFDDPTAEADLGKYRLTFSLSACTTANGCFLKVNQNGKTSPLPSKDATGGWEAEESLDLDMVSAICPNCKIRLIEANSTNASDLYAGEDAAASACGATVISNSWGGSEYAGETSDDSHFNRPGIMITASAGDNGYGVNFPAASAHVTAVGGTHLTFNGVTWQQSVWSNGPNQGTGSGCSLFVGQPSWQAALGSSYTSVCAKRIDNDVSAVADPNTGVAVYDTDGGTGGCSGWCVFGGTSASSPIIAGVYAIAGNGASLVFGSNPYSNTASLTDVTTGSNGSCGGTFLCTGETGYDGPTGLGTPNGDGAF